MTWRVAALVAAILAILYLALAAAGVDPGQAASTLWRGTFGSASAASGTLRETTPLLIGGIAVLLALKAGLFNIGVEGQLLVGALACAVVGLRMPGAGGVAFGILVGAAAGAAWALPAGLIKAYRGGHEVVTTIMLNAVAQFATTALVAGPFKDPNQQSPSTAALSASTRLPNLGSSLHVNVATVAGVLAAVGLWWWLRYSVSGFELRLSGANPLAATMAGVRTKRTTVLAMATSGAIAGIAGAAQVLAFEGRFYSGMSPGYGFDALGVALLAANALALVPSALLFGALAKGSSSLQILGVPKGVTFVVLGGSILVAAAIRYRREAVRA